MSQNTIIDRILCTGFIVLALHTHSSAQTLVQPKPNDALQTNAAPTTNAANATSVNNSPAVTSIVTPNPANSAAVSPTTASTDADTKPELGNQIKGLNAKKVGDSVVVQIDLSSPFVGFIPSFALSSPPRLVIDLPNVAHRSFKGLAGLEVGDVRSATLAQSGTRSRLVLNLTRSVPYTVFSEQDKVMIVINPSDGKSFPSQTPATPTANAGKPVATTPAASSAAGNAPVVTTTPVAPAVASPSAAATAPVRPAVTASIKEIKNIEFRRGDDAAGRLIIDLSDGSSGVDIRQVGTTLVIEVERTQLPEALRRRFDVIDFGTPVQKVSSFQQGNNTKIIIEPKGIWEHSAYQTDKRLVVDIRGIKEDPNKLVQSGSRAAYKGDKLSLNFQNIDIRSLLQVFADFTNFNIITSDSVQGNVTLRLKDVPWDQALDIVMQSKGLDSRKNGNVVLIAPRDELAAKEKLELEQKSQIANLEPVRSEVFQLQYQKADDVKRMLSETQTGGTTTADSKSTTTVTRFLSVRGSVTSDLRTNQLFVTDTPTKIEDVRKLLAKIDIPIRQVLIEARIVEASDTFSKNLGVKLGFNDRRATVYQTINGVNYPVYGAGGSMGGGVFGTISGNQQGAIDLSSQTGSGTSGTNIVGLSGGTAVGNTNFVNLPAQSISGSSPASFALSLFGSSLTRFVNLELSALEADNRGKIISSPRLVTSDGVRASISSGKEIAVSTTSSAGTNVQFKRADLSLAVTPQITPEGNVILDLEVKKDTPSEYTTAGPTLDTKSIKTQVLVENGGTVVIGGVYLQEESNQTSKVPLLGDLPFLGALFRSSQRINNKTELLIFITPRVIVNNALAINNNAPQ